MNLRRWNSWISNVAFCLALAVTAPAPAQYGTLANAGYPTYDLYGRGYGSTPTGGYGAFPYGYATGNGQIGSGYQAAGQLYNRAYQAARPQTVTNFQPLYNMITALPGWYGPAHRAHRRLHTRPSPRRTSLFDDDGKILWPSTIPDDPAAASLRRDAEEAVRTAVHESKSTRHASVRAVIDAMHKLSAFRHKVLPAVKAENTTDGAALDEFFHDLDTALDALTHVY